MQYTVVHSKDPYLLARLATDLQMEGYNYNNHYPEIQHPFYLEDKKFVMEWCDIYNIIKGFNFQSHDCNSNEDTIILELTEDNYIKVLTQILEV